MGGLESLRQVIRCHWSLWIADSRSLETALPLSHQSLHSQETCDSLLAASYPFLLQRLVDLRTSVDTSACLVDSLKLFQQSFVSLRSEAHRSFAPTIVAADGHVERLAHQPHRIGPALRLNQLISSLAGRAKTRSAFLGCLAPCEPGQALAARAESPRRSL
jgi:hypothetical protein